MKILLLTNHLADYAGSEMQILELYRYFKQREDHVHVYANYVHTPFCLEFAEQDILRDIQAIDVSQYQFIWAQHAIFARLFTEQVPNLHTRLISAHLSPYEMFELSSLHYMQKLNAYFVANSPETQNKMREFGIPASNIIISFNAAPQSFIAPPPNTPLQKIAIVSNHPPAELTEAAELLRQRNFCVDIFGINHQITAITPTLIQNYDCIVSIGKTVQYALLSNRALYCYDHFGGCGYFNAENYILAKEHNFSGRGGFGHKTAVQIADEIESGFTENLQFVQNLPDKADYVLETFMEKLLALPEIELSETHFLRTFAPLEKKVAEYYGLFKNIENKLKHEQQNWEHEKQDWYSKQQHWEHERQLWHNKQQSWEYEQQNHEAQNQMLINQLHETQKILIDERNLNQQKSQKRKRKRQTGMILGALLAGLLYYL